MYLEKQWYSLELKENERTITFKYIGYSEDYVIDLIVKPNFSETNLDDGLSNTISWYKDFYE